MEQTSIDGNQTKLQIVQSTCLLNQRLNRNTAIDGTNIIYLTGASVVFHNIFQNSKKFVQRISDSQVLGIAFYRSSQNVVALATRTLSQQILYQNTLNQININTKLNIQLYALGQNPCLLAQLNESVQFMDMVFYEKKKIILLTKQLDEYYFYFLQHRGRIKKKQVNMQKPKRFISQERKICVIGQKGLKEMDFEMQNLAAQLRFPQIVIDDYVLIENQFEVILSKDNLYCYRDFQILDNRCLNDFEQSLSGNFQPCCLVHLGRNLLIAHKNSITLSHFIVDNGLIRFLNHYTYKEKIKGGIVNMEVSFDQMHLAMAVELIEKQTTKIQNFMFNLSILASEKKFINPFIRLFPLGSQTAEVTSLQGVIPFQSYYLTGNMIVNYSFNENVQKKFKFSLHESPKQLCAHPLGYQFTCIFDTQIKFYLKIQSEIVQIWTESLICSSAKYMACGQLLMACLEDGFYQLVLYDTNSFKRIRSVPNIYIKHAITRIELIQQDSQVILYCGNDISIYVLRNGEKKAQFRQKKQKQEILAVAYDPNGMALLTSTGSKTMTFSKKIDEFSWQFKYQKVIPLKEQITWIEISNILQTVFLGTKSGKILWTQYPLNLLQKEDLTYSIEYSQLKLSQNPVSEILLTNNFKYLFVSFENEGLVVCKLKKVIKYQGSMRYNEFEISNLNFLETSSQTCLQAGQQRLKSLLQKRKTVFNDLDQYKKEWQFKKSSKLKSLQKQNKHRQLDHINEALSQVQLLKKEKQTCHQQLNKIQHQTQTFLKEKQQQYQKQIVLFYDKNINLKVKRQNVIKRCNQEYDSIQKKCKQNLQDIQDQLNKKYTVFMQNYHQMKNNISLFDKRFQIQKQQAQQILLQLFNQKRQKLQIQQKAQSKQSNELKALITKYKKQLERYNSRKYFLEQKKNFFIEEHNFCIKEKQELLDIKNQLEMELKQLEIFTNKKEKRLRKYFKQNQTLTKYQSIHKNLMTDLQREVEFIQNQKKKASQNIVAIQKELSQVAELNETYQSKIQELKKDIVKVRNKNYLKAERTRYLQHLIEEMSESLDKLKTSLNDQNKAELFRSIYRQFYIGKKLQKILQSSNTMENIQQEDQIQYKIFNSAENKKKVIENLEKHKKYLQKNMNLFQKHNKKANEEINLNYLKYQTQNYNLIAQCNVRKEQTSKKKKVLHDLIDSVKETQLYMNELQKQNFDQIKLAKSSSIKHHRSTGSIPFIEYKKSKQEAQKSRVKVLRKQESEPTLWKVRQSTYQVRKMLDIQRVKRPESENKMQRRIKTAMVKNRNSEIVPQLESYEFIPSSSEVSNNLKKPMTATGKRHQAPFGQYYTYSGVKNKSASKPTTCTIHTSKNKTSLYQ